MTLTLLSTPFSRKLFWPFDRTPLAEKPPPTASRAPGSACRTPGESGPERKRSLTAERETGEALRIEIGAERRALGLQEWRLPETRSTRSRCPPAA